MKRQWIGLLVILILSLFSFGSSFVTPNAGIIEDGYLHFDTFNPAWGIKWGLFGFLETGISQVNQGAYLKAGFNEINDIPLKFSVFYSNTFDSLSSISAILGYDFGRIYSDIGILYSQEKLWDEFYSEYEWIGSYSGFTKASVKIIEKEESESYINIEGFLNLTETFDINNYMIAFYGVQNFKNKTWIFEGINLYAGLAINNDFNTEFILAENINIVLGLSTRIKVF